MMYLLNIFLLQAQNPTTYDQVLYSYGPLGVFAVLMIGAIYWLVKDGKKQTDITLALFKDQTASLINERNTAVKDKDAATDKMISHLESTESKLLDIVKENSMAYNKVAESTDAVSKAIALLSLSIEKKNATTEEFDRNIEEILKNKL